MRILLIPLIMILFLQAAGAEDLKTRSDFLPAPPGEQSVTELFPQGIPPETGMLVSSAGILTGMTLSLITLHNSLGKSINNPGDPQIQENIAFTGACIVGSALCTILLDYFLEELRKSKGTTSEG